MSDFQIPKELPAGLMEQMNQLRMTNGYNSDSAGAGGIYDDSLSQRLWDADRFFGPQRVNDGWPTPAPAPQPDLEKDVLRAQINQLEEARHASASRIRELEAKIRVLEADKKNLEAELARRKPRIGEARTVEE